MTRKDYDKFAAMLGTAMGTSAEAEWTLIYDKVYTPLVAILKADNPRFDTTRFSYAVARTAAAESVTASVN